MYTGKERKNGYHTVVDAAVPMYIDGNIMLQLRPEIRQNCSRN